MTHSTPLGLLSGICSVALFTLAGCTGFFQPQDPSEPEERSEETDSSLEFETEPTDRYAVGANGYFTVSESTGFHTIESLDIEPRSESVEVISKTVQGHSSANFGLRSESAGDHPVEVRATLANGRELERTFEFNVREIAEMRMSPKRLEPEPAEGESPAPYLVDSRARIAFRLLDSEGESLIGFGRFPVEWEPEEALELDREASPGSRFIFRTASAPGTVTVQSTVGDETQEIELITPSMVEGLALAERALGYAPSDAELPIDGHWAGHIIPVYKGITIEDASLDVSVESKTPEVCLVVADSVELFEEETGQEVETEYPETWPGDGFVVDLRQSGECRLHAALPEANGGDGADVTESLEIVE